MTTPVVLPGAADYSGLQGIEWEGEKIAKEDLEAIHPRLSELAENADSMLRTGIWDLADIDGAEKIVMLKGIEQFRNGWADAKELNQYVQYLQETKTVILITHDTDLINLSNRLIELKDGKIIKDQILNN